MLKYFPTPYKDEVLYSILARYHLHSGNHGVTTTLIDLFNTRKITAIIDFPCSLSQLAQNLKSRIPNCQPEDLINYYTLYPFFKPFWLCEKSDRIVELMKNKSSGEIHLIAGTYASGIKHWKYLRYCPECIKEDKLNLGEAYWHRVHQLPGVFMCPIHNTPTYNSKVRTYEINQQFYYTINMRNCKTNIEEERFYNSDLSSKLYLLSEDIKWLLENGTAIKTGINHKAAYIDKLKNKGMVSKKGQVDQGVLVNEFANYYGKEFFEQLGLQINYDNTHNWVSMMVRKDSQEPHPLKHLLMIRFLFGSAKEYFTNHTKIEPFFKGPYPCLNAAADHYRSCVVNNIDIRYSRSKRPYAIFSCTCGFDYIRNGPDERDEDKYRYDSVLSYGEIWNRKFSELVERDQSHLREISRILKIDLKTVRKLIIKFGLKSKWMRDVMIKEESNSKEKHNKSAESAELEQRCYFRERWILLRTNDSNLSKTQLRKIDLKTYNWLYYHDKLWLNANSPEPIRRICLKSKVDWGKRDIELKSKAEEVVSILRKLDKPVRISIERIGKEVGKLYLIRNHIDKLPLTKAYLDSVCEDKNDFILRKARMVIDLLHIRGEYPRYWRIKQMIGLAGVIPMEVDEEINKYLRNQTSIANSR